MRVAQGTSHFQTRVLDHMVRMLGRIVLLLCASTLRLVQAQNSTHLPVVLWHGMGELRSAAWSE